MTDLIEYRLMEPIVQHIHKEAEKPEVFINMSALIEMLIADTSEYFVIPDTEAFGQAMANVILTMIMSTTGSFTNTQYHGAATYYLASRLCLELIGCERKSHTVANGNGPYHSH